MPAALKQDIYAQADHLMRGGGPAPPPQEEALKKERDTVVRSLKVLEEVRRRTAQEVLEHALRYRVEYRLDLNRRLAGLLQEAGKDLSLSMVEDLKELLKWRWWVDRLALPDKQKLHALIDVPVPVHLAGTSYRFDRVWTALQESLRQAAGPEVQPKAEPEAGEERPFVRKYPGLFEDAPGYQASDPEDLEDQDQAEQPALASSGRHDQAGEVSE